MSESRSPVYMAGQGFLESGPEPPRRWLPLLLLLGLLLVGGAAAWFVGSRQDTHRVQVNSQPEGARILLDLQDTGLDTPAALDLPATGLHGIQVRLAGHASQPLVWPILADTLKDNVILRFVLLPAGELVRLPPPLSLPPEGSSPEVLSEDLATRRLPLSSPVRSAPSVWQPSGGNRVASLRLRYWNPHYRCRLNGSEILPDAQGLLMLAGTGPQRIQVDLARSTLLDTVLVLSAPFGEHVLVLPERERFVLLHTEPVQGKILLGDRVVGTGEALLPRTLLPQQIRFAPVTGFLEPQVLDLKQDARNELTVYYLPEQVWNWQAGADGSSIALRQVGVWFENQGFREQTDGAPRIKGGSLLLGRARNDQRPWGSGQAVFDVELPTGVHDGMPAELQVVAVDTGENFPMSVRDLATLTVLFNGVALATDVKLDTETRTRSWPVSRYLRAGTNRIELRGSEGATSWTALKSLRLELQR